VSDKEREEITDQLRPYLIPASPKRSNAPACYRITGSTKERPDVWISNPFKSVVVQARSDCNPSSLSSFWRAPTPDPPSLPLCRRTQTHDFYPQGGLWANLMWNCGRKIKAWLACLKLMLKGAGGLGGREGSTAPLINPRVKLGFIFMKPQRLGWVVRLQAL